MTTLDFAYHAKAVDGVAIVLSEQAGLVVIDLDDCVLPDGSLQPAAQQIVTELDSYSEVSPSGRGVHIFVFGKLPPGRRKSQHLGIEMYETERFMTVTGNHWPSTPKQVYERTAALQALHIRVFNTDARPNEADLPQPALECDQQVWQTMFASSSGTKLHKLFTGDIAVSRHDASQAVIDLGNALAYWTKNNAEQMKRMFYQTALKRNKWEERRGEITWLDYQIKDCITYVTQHRPGQSTH